MGERKVVHRVLVGKPQGERPPLGDLGVHIRITLKCILKKLDGVVQCAAAHCTTRVTTYTCYMYCCHNAGIDHRDFKFSVFFLIFVNF